MRILIICAFILFGLSNSSKSFDTDSKCNVTSVRTQDSCFYDFPNYQFSAIIQPKFERQDIWSFKEPNIFDSFAGDAIVLSVSNIRCQEFPLILKFIFKWTKIIYSFKRTSTIPFNSENDFPIFHICSQAYSDLINI